MPSLSVILIVKNESAVLTQCLESVAAIADEIVVCDTGSTDDTVEVARRLGAQVHTIPWENDFAKARNASIARATGDWLLHMDADEVLDPLDAPALREIVDTNSDADAVEVILANYCNDPRAWRWVAVPPRRTPGQGLRRLSARRPFAPLPQSPGHRIPRSGSSENITASVLERGGHIWHSNIVIHHYGYEVSPERRLEKARFYYALTGRGEGKPRRRQVPPRSRRTGPRLQRGRCRGSSLPPHPGGQPPARCRRDDPGEYLPQPGRSGRGPRIALHARGRRLRPAQRADGARGHCGAARPVGRGVRPAGSGAMRSASRAPGHALPGPCTGCSRQGRRGPDTPAGPRKRLARAGGSRTANPRPGIAPPGRGANLPRRSIAGGAAMLCEHLGGRSRRPACAQQRGRGAPPTGSADRARESFERALRLGPGLDDARVNLDGCSA